MRYVARLGLDCGLGMVPLHHIAIGIEEDKEVKKTETNAGLQDVFIIRN